jgi:hypothetical protein
VCFHIIERTLSDLEGHEGLDRETSASGIDVRRPGCDHTELLETSKATVHRCSSDRAHPRKFQVTDPGIAVQVRQQSYVQVIEHWMVSQVSHLPDASQIG